MSVSLSTRTGTHKTETNSSDTESTTEALGIPDRWTHNITYRQLIMSTCIGIVQLWWHPYVHDMTKLVPFIFLYSAFSVFVGYPMFYLELALGVVTKKGVLSCWDLSPMSRGVGVSMLLTCALTSLALSTVAAWCLALFVHSFHSFLPWLHCAATATPACVARHRPMTGKSDTPAQSFFYNFILNLKREGISSGLGWVVPELTVYFVISWLIVYFICIKRIYSYSKLVLFKDMMAYFVLTSCAIGATQLDGAGRMFHDADWSCLFNDITIWRRAVEYALIEMAIGQGSLIMLGSHCPCQKYPLTQTVTLAFAASKTSSVTSALILGAARGALLKDYEQPVNIDGGSAGPMILWADLVTRIPGSQFWSALVFFTLFVLAVTSTALLVETVISVFTGKMMRKASWAFLILFCALVCIIGIITLCTQGGLYILNFLMKWPASKPRLFLAAITATTVTYGYGQTTFCEDVFFAVGEYPCAFMRICWAVAPVIVMVSFVAGMSYWTPYADPVGWALVVAILQPVVVVMVIYLGFKWRVRNIVGTEK